ncbi:hypothetical protein MLD38_036437 [Melastoma candidum]|uniref:Uncharacterized protein n=1 Tax=Melastoma candidum TaxID=119954 RepID=A0ACB9LJK1_9MYRT|nr:hypothetical protein MLD38_036437 [Melastoma candidum]
MAAATSSTSSPLHLYSSKSRLSLNPLPTSPTHNTVSFFSSPSSSFPLSLRSHCRRRPRGRRLGRSNAPCISCFSLSSTFPISYEFTDGSTDMELRLQLGGIEVPSPRNISVDADETSLAIRLKDTKAGLLVTLMETASLFDRIKSSETIWYLDDDQLVINLKKHDPDLKWPDIVESWESLTAGSMQLLKGTSIFIVGESTEINQKVARELAVGLGYTPLNTQELLESFAKEKLDLWATDEGLESVAEAEAAVLEILSSHVRAVVATLGGQLGAARRANRWQHLYAGFTVWISSTEATDEASAKEEAKKHIEERSVGYSNAEVVIKLQGWDADHSKSVAQASLRALKQLVLSDKDLPSKKTLYIRLGCRGDWPNIKPPGWDPTSADDGPMD